MEDQKDAGKPEDRMKEFVKDWLNGPPKRFAFPSVLKDWADWQEKTEMELLWKQWEAEGWTRGDLSDHENHPYWAWKRRESAKHDHMVSAGFALMASKTTQDGEE